MAGPQGYTHSMGRRELREGLAAYHLRRYGVAVDPEAIIVTLGSSAGFVLAFHTAFEVGAAVAVTRPGLSCLSQYLRRTGLPARRDPRAGRERLASFRARHRGAYARQKFEGLLFASPANPTGASVSAAELQEIVATCARLGVRLISDEIYHGLEYGAPAASATQFTPDALVINSFSKYFCMTGWRVGWMVLPPELVRRATMLQQSLFIAAPTLSQSRPRRLWASTTISRHRRPTIGATRRSWRRPAGAWLWQRPAPRWRLLRLCRCVEILQRLDALLLRFAGSGGSVHDPWHRLRPRRRRPVHAPFLCRLAGDGRSGAAAYGGVHRGVGRCPQDLVGATSPSPARSGMPSRSRQSLSMAARRRG